MARLAVEDGVVVHVATDKDLPRGYGEVIETIVRKVLNDDTVPIFLIPVRRAWAEEPVEEPDS